MEEIKEELRLHNLVVKTQKAAVSMDEPIEELGLFLHDLLFRFKYFQGGDFELGTYLEKGKVNKEKPPKFKSTYESSSKPKSLVSASEIEHVNLYQKLALYRKRRASESGQPIYRVFSNNAIKELCKHLPKDNDQLLTINGFGPVKVKQYGEEVLEIIITYCEENKVPAKDLFS
jgi:superfamily II DNA helicase RecQ